MLIFLAVTGMLSRVEPKHWADSKKRTRGLYSKVGLSVTVIVSGMV